MPDRPNRYSYAAAGVDIEAGNALVRTIAPVAASTARPGSDAALGGFGGLFDLKAAGFKDPLLVAANDGVGTKLEIAIETGRLQTVGIDLVAMCVNDLVVQGAEPLFFLDYLATGKLDVAEAATVIEGIADGCRQAGAALIGGETAEMPGFYAPGQFDLAGFAVGAVERGSVLPRLEEIVRGDRLLGLASSGLHSNGFSLVRRLLKDHGIGYESRAPFEKEVELAEILLRPTRIYVKSLLSLLKNGFAVKALAHITGGGFTENIPRVLPADGVEAVIDGAAWTLPPVFRWLAGLGGLKEAELVRTFNCGIGLVLVVGAEEADTVSAALTDAGETVVPLGTLKESRGPSTVTLDGAPGSA